MIAAAVLTLSNIFTTASPGPCLVLPANPARTQNSQRNLLRGVAASLVFWVGFSGQPAWSQAAAVAVPAGVAAPALAMSPTMASGVASGASASGFSAPGASATGSNANASTNGTSGTNANNTNGNASVDAADNSAPADSNAPEADAAGTAEQAVAGREIPSDFQRFVQQVSGKLLPIYGRELFTGSRFQALQGVQVPDTYIVGPGDELVLQAFGLVEFAERITVGRDGQVTLPKVGPIKVAGLKFSELQPTLTRSLGQVYRNFTLQVSMGRLRSIEIFVLGQARAPGKKVVSSLSTLINALFETGGPSAKGSMRHIELRRNGKTVAKVDLYRFIAHGDSAGDLPLQSGDIVFIPPVGQQVGLVGSINQEAIYELVPGQDSVEAVLAISGGLPTLAAPQKAQLDRVDPSRQPARYVEDFALDSAGLQTKLRGGDVLSVFQVSPQIANAVTLQGNVAAPMRYAYRKGMRVTDLVVDNTFLVPISYWLRINSGANVGGYSKPEVNPDYATIQRLDPITLRTEVIAFNPSRALAGDEAENLPLQPGDLVRIYGPNEAGPETLNTVTIRGEIVGGTKRFAWRQGMGIKHIIPSAEWLVQRYNYWQRPSGDSLRSDINWDYAQIIRRVPDTLQTRAIEFNLGAAIMGKGADVKLEPGDEVALFTTAQLPLPVARRIRIVKLGGEVATPGAYQVLPGETLTQLIIRAGGLTPQAYLYGAEFSRASVRAVQQRNLSRVIDELQQQLASEAATAVANTATSDANTAAMLLQSQRAIRVEQLARLRGQRSNGRVALELPAGTLSLADLPAIQLEDGDSFTVPPQPSFVAAFGAVHNENVIVYRPGRTAQDVLSVAAPTMDAELDEVFVVRADGTIVSPRANGWARRTLLGGSVGSTELMPGDSVVVPTKVDRETGWSFITRQFKDWTQILGNLGLGVAAFKSL